MPWVSPQSDAERFIPGTNVVYDNEIYTCLFLKKRGVKEALRIQFRISGWKVMLQWCHEWVPRVAWKELLPQRVSPWISMGSIHVFFFKKRCQRSATDSIPNLWMKSHAATMPWVSPQSGVERVTPSKSKSWNPSNMVKIYTCLCISSCTLWLATKELNDILERCQNEALWINIQNFGWKLV